MLLGFVFLVVGGEFSVRASVALSLKLNISKMVIGLTVVSFATSLPELLVSLNATLNGSPSIAINNVIGSNIANIGLVLGITVLLGTIHVDKTFYKFNWPALMIFSFVFYYFLSNDNKLDAIEGTVLFLSLLLFIAYSLKQSDGAEIDDSIDVLTTISNFKIIHIDPSENLILDLTLDEMLIRIFELYDFCYSVAFEYNKQISIEISLGKEDGGISHLSEIEYIHLL